MAEIKAFGIEPSSRKFHLRLARYMGLCDAIRDFREREAASGNSRSTLKLLDVGAGHGRTLMYLKAHGLDDNIEFYGVDNAQGRRNRLFEPDRWNYQLLDVEDGLPFDDGFFDIVICEQVLEHLKRPDFVLSEISRVMRPGGLAILGVPNFPPGFDLVRRHIVPRIDRITGKNRDHEQVFTQSRFTRLIESSGDFEVRRVQAFRCISGGLLKGLENHKWWYSFSRTVATALSPLAIEIQALAERQPAVLTAPAANASDSFLSNLRPRTVAIGAAMCALVLVSTGWLLSDATHASLFSDSGGLVRGLSIAAWVLTALGIAYCLRTRLGTAIAFAGTALAAGAIEGRVVSAISGLTPSEALSRFIRGSMPSEDRLVLSVLALAIAACLLTALGYLWHHLRSRGGLHQTWVRLMGAALVMLMASQLIEYALLRSGLAPGEAIAKAFHALEEGMELTLPLLLLLGCMTLATVLGQPRSEAHSRLA